MAYTDAGSEPGIVCGGTACSRNVADCKAGGDAEDAIGAGCYEEWRV